MEAPDRSKFPIVLSTFAIVSSIFGITLAELNMHSSNCGISDGRPSGRSVGISFEEGERGIPAANRPWPISIIAPGVAEETDGLWRSVRDQFDALALVKTPLFLAGRESPGLTVEGGLALNCATSCVS